MSSAPPSRTNAPPAGLRVVRPYRDEAELLVAEASAFTRSGVVLIGAPNRPVGVVLRFEIVLSDGTSVMRGEGRVVEYRAGSSGDDGALAVRFTRLDLRSKEVLDRAIARRELQGQRVHSVAPPAWSESEPSPHARRSTMPPSIVDRMSAVPSRTSSLPISSVDTPGALPQARMPTISVPPPLPGGATPPHAVMRGSSINAPPPASRPLPSGPIELIVDEGDEDDGPVHDVDDADFAAADEHDLTEQLPLVAPVAGVTLDALNAKPRTSTTAGTAPATFQRLRQRSGKTAGLDVDARAAALERLRARASQPR